MFTAKRVKKVESTCPEQPAGGRDDPLRRDREYAPRFAEDLAAVAGTWLAIEFLKDDLARRIAPRPPMVTDRPART